MKFNKFGYEIEIPAPEQKRNFTINRMSVRFCIDNIEFEMIKRSQLITWEFINNCQDKKELSNLIEGLKK